MSKYIWNPQRLKSILVHLSPFLLKHLFSSKSHSPSKATELLLKAFTHANQITFLFTSTNSLHIQCFKYLYSREGCAKQRSLSESKPWWLLSTSHVLYTETFLGVKFGGSLRLREGGRPCFFFFFIFACVCALNSTGSASLSWKIKLDPALHLHGFGKTWEGHLWANVRIGFCIKLDGWSMTKLINVSLRWQPPISPH